MELAKVNRALEQNSKVNEKVNFRKENWAIIKR